MPRKKKKPSFNFFWIALGLIAIFFICLLIIESKDSANEEPLTDQEVPEKNIAEIDNSQEKDLVTPLYSIAELSKEVKIQIARKLIEISPVYSEIKESDAPFLDSGQSFEEWVGLNVDYYSFAFDYGGQRYVVAADYSGGDHCCFGWYVFTLSSQNELRVLKSKNAIATGGNVAPEGQANIIEKNGKIYLKLYDDRFAYYCGSYSSTPLFGRYFAIKEKELVLANQDFSSDFLKTAESKEKELQGLPDLLGSAADKLEQSDLIESRCRLAVEAAANYYLGGEIQRAESILDMERVKISSLAQSESQTAKNYKEEVLGQLILK